jgi:hypothetical protein
MIFEHSSAMTRCRRLLFMIAALSGAAFFAGDDAFAQYQPVIRQGVCTFQYQPVCAVSRKRTLITYGNACDARNARARIVSDGACNDACPQIYKPVCARDAKGARRTFANACTAKAAAVELIHRGRCLLPAR